MVTKTLEGVYGYILKKESIKTVEDNIVPGTLVFKSWVPYPGFFEKSAISIQPEFFFLVMNDNYPLEEITRAAQIINKKFTKGFGTAHGEVTIFDNTYQVIRIKNYEKENIVKKLQENFIKEGIELLSHTESLQGDALIMLKKFFSLEKVEENIYFDRQEPEIGYFTIPYRMEWDPFEEMTYRIKVNVALGIFDAAIGMFYRQNMIRDVARIFNQRRSVENLKMIRQQYLREMEVLKV